MASRRRSSGEAAPRAPRPVTTSGRFAAQNTSTAVAIAAASGGSRRGGLACIHSSSTSCGGTRARSTRSGFRRRPGRARRHRRCARHRLVELADDLLGEVERPRVRVTGLRMSTCGMPCSGPMFACGRGGQPPISRTGARARKALATAVTVLVTPGPAVTRATPNPPASSACACAMCTATPSSRTSMMRMPCWATWSQSGWICPPCRPKTRSMPRVLRKRAPTRRRSAGSRSSPALP